MFIVGIDIAKRSHEAVIINSDGQIVRKAFVFKNDLDGFKKLLSESEKLSTNKSDFIFAMESTSHYWLAVYSALLKQGFETKVINPIQSDALRNLYIRQVKNDSHDSFIIAQVIRFGHYSEGSIQASEYFELRELCRARSYIVDLCSDIKRKTICLLDQVFPEYETLFSDIFGVTSMEILKNCPLPEDILAIDTDKLTEMISVASRKKFKKDKAEQIKSAAQNSFGIIIGITSIKILLNGHIEHIKFMEQQIADIDKQIVQLYNTFDCKLTTIPGIGPVSAAIILSEIGDVSRFSSATKLAAFAGIDPTVKQSGEFNSSHNHMSKRGSPYLRRAIWQASVLAVMYEPNLKTFFEQKRSEGKPYMNAIGHVTRKLTNIIYAVLRDNKPYYLRQ
ncbi:IS110 family transposase [Chakrabartyella piscis]|uniref:IS110 family transposase n=1 Tax=Chakrabartyella piscis TaxID=2918914 RepID=UPI0029585F2E|nr:IS110 family transposase [Chakrabartyella piscis]